MQPFPRRSIYLNQPPYHMFNPEAADYYLTMSEQRPLISAEPPSEQSAPEIAWRYVAHRSPLMSDLANTKWRGPQLNVQVRYIAIRTTIGSAPDMCEAQEQWSNLGTPDPSMPSTAG